MSGWSEAGTKLTTGDNVGIGTDNPQSVLHANGVVTITTGAGPDCRVVLGPGGESSSLIRSEPDRGRLAVSTTGSKLSFATYPIVIGTVGRVGEGGTPPPTSPIDRVTIDSAGHVGIGTEDPLTTLDVRGEASFEGTVILNQAGAPVARTKADPRAGLTFGAGDAQAVFFLGTDATSFTTAATLGLYSYQLGNSLQCWASNGNVGIGTDAPTAKLHVAGDIISTGNVTAAGNVTVSGDVLLTGADCAERFDVDCGSSLEPGTVVVIDENGALRESTEAYDRRVAGVVSGAGDYRPALLLDNGPGREGCAPLALVGKVFCKVDATNAPVQFGDLLTTAQRPGHAMKASDPAKAFGAVIGKALKSLPDGVGLIPILVALQ